MTAVNPVPMKDIHEPFDAKIAEGHKGVNISNKQIIKKKLSEKEIYEIIYNSISDWHPNTYLGASLNHISRTAGLSISIVKKRLEIIMLVNPFIIKETKKFGARNRTGYRKLRELIARERKK